ncbi:MAG: TIGR02186 family protein [Pseudomonadota bacterium]
MRWLALIALIAAPLASPVAAQEEIVADLSQNEVAITTTFTGSEILIFGAVKRGAEVDETYPLHALITVAAPSAPVVVRKKDRVAGIWVNTEEVHIDSAPAFYAIETSAAFADTISDTEDLRYRISTDRAIRVVGAAEESDHPEDFQEALTRIRQTQGAYVVDEGGVTVTDEVLIRSSVGLPANLVEGDYEVRIFLTRNREVVSTFETSIAVNKVGLERFLFSLSRERPLIYGLMAIAIAIAAGWLASAAFRVLRP